MARGLSFALCVQTLSGMRMSNVDSKLQAQPCSNPKFTAVPQTNIGYGSSLVQPMMPDGKLVSTSMPAVTFNVTQSYDANMNILQKFTTHAPRRESTVILSWDAGTLSTQTKTWSTAYGDAEITCATGPLPPQMQMISKDMLMGYVALSTSMLDCVESVGGNDQYKMAFPPDFLPSSMAADLPFQFNYTMEATPKGLMRKERMDQVVMNAPGSPYQSTLVATSMDYPEGSLKGLSKKDLKTPDSWGECDSLDLGTSYVDFAVQMKSNKMPVVGVMHQLLDAARVVENQGLSAALAAGQAMKEMMSGAR